MHCYKDADIYSNLQHAIYVIMYIFKQKDGEVAQCSLAKKKNSALKGNLQMHMGVIH